MVDDPCKRCEDDIEQKNNIELPKTNQQQEQSSGVFSKALKSYEQEVQDITQILNNKKNDKSLI